MGRFRMELSAGDMRAEFERVLATHAGVMNPADLPSTGCRIHHLL